MQNKAFIQHPGKVVETDGRFRHVMAVALDPTSRYQRGIVRCITSREGDVQVKGYIDRSEIHYLSAKSLEFYESSEFSEFSKSRGFPEHFKIGEQIKISDTDVILKKLSVDGLDFIGFEDPDIFFDEKADLMHVYFTLPFLNKKKGMAMVHVGHAVGRDLDSLKMTMPVLEADPKTYEGAKEISVAPINSKGFRYNLFESSKKEADFTYSTVRIAIAETMDGPWKWGDTIFHPKDHADKAWIAGHASPGPLFPKHFIDLGGTRLVGVMNGREANRKVGDKTVYGMFSVGLFIYDYEIGKIEWVSPEPFILDTEAKTITFASQFVETAPGKGILYAHVDDSFVRAYTVDTEGVRELLPKRFL